MIREFWLYFNYGPDHVYIPVYCSSEITAKALGKTYEVTLFNYTLQFQYVMFTKPEIMS